MPLNTRGLPFIVPSYSLTGDILSFQRCGLQYRYYNGSSLPPSRPVQMWTGNFVHGVLEEAYRRWAQYREAFPWPYTPRPWPPNLGAPLEDNHDIGTLGHRVEVRLGATGLRSRSEAAREAAYNRAEAAVNLLCPHLFPLITLAEEPISGTRHMPPMPAGQEARGTRYELVGIADVISSVGFETNHENPIVQLVQAALPNAPAGDYDLIVDYKTGRRPSSDSSFAQQYAWQLQTYAWLRRQIPQTRAVGAGVIVYVNELRPSKTDLVELKRELRNGATDVAPANGTADYYAINSWQPGEAGQPGHNLPNLSPEFRLRRALSVIDVSSGVVQHALDRIDSVVAHIESSAFRENNSGNIPDNWEACGEPQDCDACDFFHFCPSPAQSRANQQQQGAGPLLPRAPLAPG
jgi:CRISPR/Cas system-associated exonuclease Cas4 (RecB family)